MNILDIYQKHITLVHISTTPNFVMTRSFVLFIDTWSQEGHSVSYMTILFSMFANHPNLTSVHVKWAVSLVIADGHFNLPQGFVWVCSGKYTRFIK